MAEDQVTGKVIRLYVNKLNASIRLDINPATGPKGNYFRLRLNHPNYNALYSLALAAAANRWPLRIKIEGGGPISNDNDNAMVEYMVVDWEAGQDKSE